MGSVRVVVHGGTDDHFSVGHDMKEWRELSSDFGVEDRWELEEKRYYDYSLRI